MILQRTSGSAGTCNTRKTAVNVHDKLLEKYLDSGDRYIYYFLCIIKKHKVINSIKKPLKPCDFNGLRMAGAEGLEPSARGFGDHCSTN